MSTGHEPAYAVNGRPELDYQRYHEEKAKGYVSAELLMLPMFIGLAEEGKIEIGGSEDFMVIGSKGTLDKFKGDKNGN